MPFVGLVKQNASPDVVEKVRSVWERFVLAALHAVEAHSPEDAADAAATVADELVIEWDERFNEKSVLNPAVVKELRQEPPEDE